MYMQTSSLEYQTLPHNTMGELRKHEVILVLKDTAQGMHEYKHRASCAHTFVISTSQTHMLCSTCVLRLVFYLTARLLVLTNDSYRGRAMQAYKIASSGYCVNSIRRRKGALQLATHAHIFSVVILFCCMIVLVFNNNIITIRGCITVVIL